MIDVVLRCSICGGREFVDAVDNQGNAYRGCARCVVVLDDVDRALVDFVSFFDRALDRVRRKAESVTERRALHRAVDTLLALYLLDHEDRTPSSTSVAELVEWSHARIRDLEARARAKTGTVQGS